MNKEIIPTATADEAVTPAPYFGGIPPEPFDLRVSLLPPERAAWVTRMVMDKYLEPDFSIDAMILNGEMWIDHRRLISLMPIGHLCLSDDADCSHFPPSMLVDRAAVNRRQAEWEAARALDHQRTFAKVQSNRLKRKYINGPDMVNLGFRP